MEKSPLDYAGFRHEYIGQGLRRADLDAKIIACEPLPGTMQSAYSTWPSGRPRVTTVTFSSCPVTGERPESITENDDAPSISSWRRRRYPFSGSSIGICSPSPESEATHETYNVQYHRNRISMPP